jgi:uncharacterized membrane protein YecN with MAPEG domain
VTLSTPALILKQERVAHGVNVMTDKDRQKADARTGGMVATAVLVILAILTTIVVMLSG